MNVAKKVARNAFYRTAAVVVGNLSGLFLTVVLARVLKPEQFGVYSLTLSIAMLSIAFSNLGIDGAVVRYIAYYRGKKDLRKIRGHLRYFLRAKLVLALLISFTLIFFSGKIATVFNNPALEIPMKFAGCIVLFSSLVNVLNAFFSGLQEFRYVFVKQAVYELSRWFLVIPLSCLFLAAGALEGVALAYVVTLIVLAIVAIRRFKEFLLGNSDKVDEKVLSFMGFMTIASVSGIIYTYVDSLMIGYFLTATDVGFYRAAFTIVFAIVGLITLGDILLPVFTQLEGADLKNALNRLARYSSSIAFPAALGLAFLSEYVIVAVYGQEYLSAAQVMMILSFVLIPASFNYLGAVFSAKEIPKYSAYITTVSMLLNIILNYFFINAFGISGAALATLISRVFSIVFVVYLLYRILGLGVPIGVSVKPAICSAIMLTLLVILPSPKSLIFGFAEVVFAAVVYFGLLFVVKGITLEDVRYVAKALGIE